MQKKDGEKKITDDKQNPTQTKIKLCSGTVVYNNYLDNYTVI